MHLSLHKLEINTGSNEPQGSEKDSAFFMLSKMFCLEILHSATDMYFSITL